MTGGFASAAYVCDTAAGTFDTPDDPRSADIAQAADIRKNAESSIVTPTICGDPNNPGELAAGVALNQAWMYNGLGWDELPPMSTTRDRPHCSLIQDEHGSVSRI